MIDMEDINRLEIILIEKNKTGKWFAEKLGKSVNGFQIIRLF